MARKKSVTQLGEEMVDEHIDPIEQKIKQVESTRLSHDETLRASALSLACRYYVETIVKDGDLYREMVRDNRVLKPATYMGVLEVALSFEAFIRGELSNTANAVLEDSEIEELTDADRKETPTPETEQPRSE